MEQRDENTLIGGDREWELGERQKGCGTAAARNRTVPREGKLRNEPNLGSFFQNGIMFKR